MEISTWWEPLDWDSLSFSVLFLNTVFPLLAKEQKQESMKNPLSESVQL